MSLYPDDVKKIAKIFNENGYEAYAVGGCIRDMVMGRTPNDWDMTTSCSPEKMLEIFENAGVRTIPTGLKHGTVSVLIDKNTYECTTYRIDGSYTDSRHPDKVTFTSRFSDDLCRRDFTVNAMAGDPLKETDGIVDLFEGINDINNKIIRAVGDPEKRFSEDALRILRAIRFATVLNFDIEESTKKAAVKLKERLKDISAERKTSEFQKMLLSPYADRGMELLFETDIAKYIHPDIKMPSTPLKSLKTSFITRLAALFNEVPSLGCMKLSNEITKGVKSLCDRELYESCRHFFDNDEANARLMISKLGDLAIDAAILRGDAGFSNIIEKEYKKSPCVSIKQLNINGNDLLSAKIEAKKLGNIMNSLLLKVIESPEKNQKDELLNIALSYNI